MRTHVLTALAHVLPLLNCAANWANARPVLDCLVDAAAVTLGQIIALQRLESGGGGPGTPPRAPVRQGSGSLLSASHLPPGSDPVLLPALAGMLQVALRAIRYVIASNGALGLRPDAAAAVGVATVGRYLTCRTPLLETVQTALVQLSPRSDALRVSALTLLDPLVTAGEAAPLALHAGLVNCLQQALASEELQGRAAAVVLRLCCHAQAREYVGGLVTNGLVTALAATLASVRHPDDVIVETYATLQRVYDFAFMRDVMQALGACVAKWGGAGPGAVPEPEPFSSALVRSAARRERPRPREAAQRGGGRRRRRVVAAGPGPRAAGRGRPDAAPRRDVRPLARLGAADGADGDL